eukprot:23855_1
MSDQGIIDILKQHNPSFEEIFIEYVMIQQVRDVRVIERDLEDEYGSFSEHSRFFGYILSNYGINKQEFSQFVAVLKSAITGEKEETKSLPQWTEEYVLAKSEYCDQSEGSYTLNVLEMALRLQIDSTNKKPSTSLIDNVFKMTSLYTSDIYIRVKDILQNVTYYKQLFSSIYSIQCNVNDLDKVIAKLDLHHVCVISKIVMTPQSVCLHKILHAITKQEEYILYDPHTRIKRDLHGPHFLRFADLDQLQQYLKTLFPYIDLGGNINYMINQCEATYIQLSTEAWVYESIPSVPQINDKTTKDLNKLSFNVAIDSKVDENVHELDEFLELIRQNTDITFIRKFINWLRLEEYDWESLSNDIDCYIDEKKGKQFNQSNIYLFLIREKQTNFLNLLDKIRTLHL